MTDWEKPLRVPANVGCNNSVIQYRTSGPCSFQAYKAHCRPLQVDALPAQHQAHDNDEGLSSLRSAQLSFATHLPTNLLFFSDLFATLPVCWHHINAYLSACLGAVSRMHSSRKLYYKKMFAPFANFQVVVAYGARPPN